MDSHPGVAFSDQTSTVTAGDVRPFEVADRPSIDSLRRHRTTPRASAPGFSTGRLLELVYVGEDGSVCGYLRATQRPMLFRGSPVEAAIVEEFVADEGSIESAAIGLGRALLAGGHDISLASSQRFPRSAWESIGGGVCPLYTMSWSRALRPAQSALRSLRANGMPRVVAAGLKPLCKTVDAALPFLPQRSFRHRPTDLIADGLDPVTLMAFLTTVSPRRSLHAVYTADAVTAALDAVQQRGRRLESVVLRMPSGMPLGWYIYALDGGNVAEVLDFDAREEFVTDLLRHLFHHAWSRGAIRVTGPLYPWLMSPLAQQLCRFERPGDDALLVHANDARILNTIHSGDAVLRPLFHEV